MIEHARDEVLAQLPEHIEVRFHGAIRRVIALRAAGIIESSFFRETSYVGGATTRDDLTGAFLGDLRALQAAIPGYVAIACHLSAREQLAALGLAGWWERECGVYRVISLP